MAPVSPLIVIVGETASGKSTLALELAKKFNGEIICADSRTVYKGMDIGTAKPTKQDQALVTHHLIDIISPNDSFSAAQFKERALRAIENISTCGKLPILVGGTGLYIDAVIYDFNFSKPGSVRDEKNPRHLKPEENKIKIRMLRPRTLVLGVRLEPEQLQRRINKRVEYMFKNGLEAEVKSLAKQYGWEAEAMTGVGYREFKAHLDGTQSLEETEQLIKIHTRQYAKRQRTWFKRDVNIQWCKSSEQAFGHIEHFFETSSVTIDQ